MQEHAHEDVTKSKLEARSQDVEALSSAAKPVTLHDHAALSFGTWAINNGDTNIISRTSRSTASDGDIDYCPKAKNPFYERVAWVYSGGVLAGGSNDLTLTYGAVEGMMWAFAGEAASNELEIVVPVPVVAGKTDGSPEGADCGIGASLETMAGRPANPAGVNLVARHNRNNMQTGVLQKRSFTMDFLAMEPGYESTPFKNGNKKYQQAWKKRGQFYMGATSDTP